MPLIIREHPLTDSGVRLNAYLFNGYMALPFLWELRTALDWTVEPTSLDLFRTLKLEVPSPSPNLTLILTLTIP